MFSEIIQHCSVIVAIILGIFTCSLVSDKVIAKADTCIIESKDSNYPRCSVTTPAELECNQEKKEITITTESTKDALIVECSASYILDVDFDGEQPFENVRITPEWRNETDGETFVLHFLPWQSSAAAALVGKYTFFALNNKTIEQSFYIYYKGTDDNKHLLMFPDKRKIKGYYRSINNSRKYILPCRPLSKTTDVSLMLVKNEAPVDNLPCVSFNNQLGFIVDVDAGLCSEFFNTTGNDVKCEAKNKGLSDSVEVEVNLTIPDDYNDVDIPIDARLKISFNTFSSDPSIYRNLSYQVTCQVVVYGTASPILWYIQEDNKEFVFRKTVPVNHEAPAKYLEIKEDFYISKSLTGIMCAARLWDSMNWFNTSFKISSKVPIMPSFQKTTEKLTFYTGENNKFLVCNPNGSPVPQIKWFKNGKSIDIEKGTGLAGLKFSTVEKSIEGIYTCKATNDVGESVKTFILSVEDPSSTGIVTIGIAVVVVFLFSGIAVFLTIFYYQRSKKYLLSSREMNAFLNGNSTGNSDRTNHYVSIPYRYEDYEISKCDLNIEENSVLGSGQFGIVCKGKFENMDVAVKTTKEDCDKTYIMSILEELKIMIHIGKHENIVYLVGAVTKEARKGQVFLVLELYSGGSLEGRLRSRQHFINSEGVGELNISGYENLSKTDVVTITEALRWSFEIANAMDYLSKKNVIHGDLATRNILLDDRLCAKISDFGLSRKLYQYGTYEKSSKDPLPWRWMAIESLRFNTFSLKSDIWSYGVLLWEIFSKGDIPYPGQSWTVDFVSNLLGNLRLGKPKHADEEMYTLMCGCWNEDPEQRISFCDLMERISEKITKTPSISFESATHQGNSFQYEDVILLEN